MLGGQLEICRSRVVRGAELAKECPAAKPAELFQAIYVALLGKPRGPRAGAFIAALGPGFCARRFAEAAA